MKVGLVLLETIDGFDVPECVLADGDVLYVSNIESEPGEYWNDDGRSHISRISADLQKRDLRWLDSSEEFPIHSAKGMCRLGSDLYFTDNTRLLRCDAITGEGLAVVAQGFEKANDLATDGRSVWLSDVAQGKVFCISPDGTQREIQAPAGVNGLTFRGDKMFAVSWDLHDLYELDPSGKKAPVAFGLAEHFTNLDGIETLDDGSFLVSDFKGNQVCHVSADRQRVTKLADVTTPADIGINREQGLLYVPSFLDNKVLVYRIKGSTE
ncbi:hypothetical protein HW115_13015 [Verrucomicrobiaceae bacterium N1E253]|uniref:SMP-30/Gluconolactonase/LRE-like region domain-containing protein n=1 Tax=Oceaniferula marina TaxID=2748318 RepID=A0A851GN24_9BACT|nr:hypothetical protein [Oceaniferula marina]NWK56535.1 hypothetical protein [Oceaniferula marina]